jgi:hypothetical protein
VTGHEVTRKLSYVGAGAPIFRVGIGPDRKIYGSTAIPLELFRYDPRTGKTENLGNPGFEDGQIYSMGVSGKRLYMAAYPSSVLGVYDPGRKWKPGTAKDANPRRLARFGDGHLRPIALAVGRDRRIYVGSFPPYGQLGGALGIYDPELEKVVENYRDLIPDQSISALAYESRTSLLFGGSNVGGGMGIQPKAREAHLFAWDPATRKVVIDLVPVVGDRAVVAMVATRGKVFAVSEHSHTLTVVGARTGRVLDRIPIPFGRTLDGSLGVHRGGTIYGLTAHGVYKIDPRRHLVREVARYEAGITHGFAITRDSVYFGSGVRLVRYHLR